MIALEERRREACAAEPPGDERVAALSEEFGAPFRVQEAGGEGGGARVDPLPGGGWRLTLPLYREGRPSGVAVADLPPDAEGAPGRRNPADLQKWARAVADRLRLEDALEARARIAPAPVAPSALETLQAVTRVLQEVSLHKESARSHGRILEAALQAAEAETIAWVPAEPDRAILEQGANCLSPADYLLLAASLTRHRAGAAEPLLCNDVAAAPWGGPFPAVRSLLAFPLAADQAPLGWLLALNRRGDERPAGFRPGDVTRLAPLAALSALYLHGTARHGEMKELLVGLTHSLTAALDARDAHTYGHSERVARIAVELARELGLPEEERGDVYLAGLLHDIGKVGVRDSVMGKTGPLTPEEYEHVKQHVTIGYGILSDLRPIRALLPGVLYHHERWDGTGYPDGLAGEAIPLLARVLAVADAYDAMTSTRPFREARPHRQVEEILVAGAGKQWDRRVVEAFLRCRHRVYVIRQRGAGDSLHVAIDRALRNQG